MLFEIVVKLNDDNCLSLPVYTEALILHPIYLIKSGPPAQAFPKDARLPRVYAREFGLTT
jgi:hypothetical protein